MLNREELTEIIRTFEPEATFSEGTQFLEAIVPAEKLFALAEKLKSDTRTSFNYLINHTAVDFVKNFTVVYHLESTEERHIVVLKSVLEDRENAKVDSLTALYPTVEFFEREVFDLFGIHYNNHPYLKRLFMEDGQGFPLRKDFRDEVNIIER
jgi:NADH:ubiquinone oxidoreductase subunit C